MKNNKIVDERVISQTIQIKSEAYTFVMLFLIISVLVKQFVFKLGFESYAVEFIAFFGSSFYILFRSVFKGNNLYHQMGKITPIKNSIILAITVTITMVFINFKEFNNLGEILFESIESFISSFITAYLFFIIVDKLAIRRSNLIEKEYDDEE